MSKFVEYLKLVPSGIKNLPQIIEGLSNQIKMELGAISEQNLDIILKRRLICSTCPFLSTNATQAGIYATDRQDVHCVMCGCPITTKTASLESNCGIETYNNENPSTPMPLKWEKTD